MKIDIDTIFYIILSIIILVVSGLGSRRRKQAQQMKRPVSSAARLSQQELDEMEIPQARGPVPDPFDRLEQILTGQSRYETLEGESLEVMEDEEEMIMDEEEKIMVSPITEMKQEQQDITTEEEDEFVKRPRKDLFEDVDEITRAIIYREILPRKYS
jgi:FtsZ-interacting cell division protein ZipA